VITGKTHAGTLSAPNTVKAREAGLNLLADIGKLNIPGLQVAYGTTEKHLKSYPGTGKMLDDTYEAFAPYWTMSLGVRAETIQAQFKYMDEKEFPQAKNADPKQFFDNSFVDMLDKAGFLAKLGMSR
jgi:hypothetical protein